MRLTTQLIFDRLSELYNVRYTVCNDKNTIVGRPLFYQNDRDITGHICILSAPGFICDSLDQGVFISIGDLRPNFSTHHAELLTVPYDVSENSLFNSLQDIFDYYDAWENEMNTIIQSDKGYSDIIQCATKYLNCPISMVDEDFTIIALSDSSSDELRDSLDQNKLSNAIMNDLVSDPLFSKGLHNNDVFEFTLGGEVFLSYNFKRDGRYLGRISLYYQSKKSKESYTYLVRFLAHKVEVLLNKFGSFLIHKETFSALHEIFAESLTKTSLHERHYTEFKLNENGWSYNDEYLLIRLQPEFRHEWQLHSTYLIPLVERMWPGACAIENDKYIVVLLNKDIYNSKSNNNFIQEMAYFLRESLMLAGISRPFKGLDQIPTYFKQTELAVSLGRDADPTSWYYCFDDYALVCWIKFGTMSFNPEQICSKVLLDLISYDKANNTEYYKTLQTFYNNKYSYTHAADDLYIHRTTLIKRIERIIELTDIDLDDPSSNLYIGLSFRYLDSQQ